MRLHHHDNLGAGSSLYLTGQAPNHPPSQLSCSLLLHPSFHPPIEAEPAPARTGNLQESSGVKLNRLTLKDVVGLKLAPRRQRPSKAIDSSEQGKMYFLSLCLVTDTSRAKP
ncbi:hypothetical protein CRENBAI_008374 [Crenichthys baileyi]|uniref:Uncharacterized protein n=1 Tax=Crenichthys baileyi TaxID=28760 RepID=A0AAV9SJA6_9TELE